MLGTAHTERAQRSESLAARTAAHVCVRQGDIASWLRRKHKHTKSEEPMEIFANGNKMRGEQIVALDTVHRLDDSFYLQWLTLHVPFRQLQELRLPARGFALALCLTDSSTHVPADLRGFWRDENRIRAEMREDAHTEDHITYMLAFVGAINKGAEEDVRASGGAAAETAGAAVASRQNVDNLVFNQEQHEIDKRLDLAKVANHSADAEEAREVAMDTNRPVVCLGPPGTGKTTVVTITKAASMQLKTLVAAGLAQLASRVRARLGNLDKVGVDTLHAAFTVDGLDAESYPLMTPCDLVVIHEISQLDQGQFERILRLWRVADKVPALNFLGDKWQLPGVGGRGAWESAEWLKSKLRFVKLTHAWRCKDEGFRKILNALRTGIPTKESRLVEKICRGHKAWYGDEPNIEDLSRLLRDHPETMIITCTRNAAATGWHSRHSTPAHGHLHSCQGMWKATPRTTLTASSRRARTCWHRPKCPSTKA